MPAKISFRMGGMAALLLSVVVVPWQSFSTSQHFVEDFLVGYSIITGAVLGVLLSHYYVRMSQYEHNEGTLCLCSGDF